MGGELIHICISWPPIMVVAQGAGLAMLTEVLQGAPLTHLVQLQSHHIKRNLPHDTAWLTEGQPPRTVGHVVLPGADCLPSAAGTTVDPTSHSPRQSPLSPGDGALPECSQYAPRIRSSRMDSRWHLLKAACACDVLSGIPAASLCVIELAHKKAAGERCFPGLRMPELSTPFKQCTVLQGRRRARRYRRSTRVP